MQDNYWFAPISGDNYVFYDTYGVMVWNNIITRYMVERSTKVTYHEHMDNLITSYFYLLHCVVIHCWESCDRKCFHIH